MEFIVPFECWKYKNALATILHLINQPNRQDIGYSKLNQKVNELEDSTKTAVQGNLYDTNVTGTPPSSSSNTAKEKEKERETNAENVNNRKMKKVTQKTKVTRQYTTVKKQSIIAIIIFVLMNKILIKIYIIIHQSVLNVRIRIC